MAITPQRMQEIIRDRKLVVRPHPDGGFIAETHRGTRLHRGPRPTLEESVEAAELTLVETEERNEEARKGRLFDLLATGVFYPKSRMTTVIDDDGKPIAIRVWDLFASGDDRQIASGERSLIAAILAAESAGLTNPVPGIKAR